MKLKFCLILSHVIFVPWHAKRETIFFVSSRPIQSAYQNTLSNILHVHPPTKKYLKINQKNPKSLLKSTGKTLNPL